MYFKFKQCKYLKYLIDKSKITEIMKTNTNTSVISLHVEDTVFSLLIVPTWINCSSDLIISTTIMSLFRSYRDLLFRTIL